MTDNTLQTLEHKTIFQNGDYLMKKSFSPEAVLPDHVTPNSRPLLPTYKSLGMIGTLYWLLSGMERKLIEQAGIPYDGISSGKLRRYFDWKNFSDPFRVLKGCSEARKLLKKYKPDVIFSKGGFVAVPVVLAAKH